MGRPSKSEARCKMCKASVDTRRGTAIISREDHAGRGRRINRGLLSRPEAVDRPAVVKVVRQRAVDLPCKSIVKGEIGPDLPGILGVEVVFLSSSINEAAAALTITIRDSQQEVGSRIASRKLTAGAKREITVILEEKWIGHMEA